MPRRPRGATGGDVYRAWNRAVGRSTIFETEAELKALRRSPQGGTPFGETVWQQATAKRLGLESTLRPPGRPRRKAKQS